MSYHAFKELPHQSADRQRQTELAQRLSERGVPTFWVSSSQVSSYQGLYPIGSEEHIAADHLWGVRNRFNNEHRTYEETLLEIMTALTTHGRVRHPTATVLQHLFLRLLEDKVLVFSKGKE